METPSIIAWLQRDAAANNVGGKHGIQDFTYGSVQVTGTFTADVQLQVSNDGETWVDFGVVINSASITELDLHTVHIRAEVENYVGGSLSVILVAKR